MQGRTVTLKVVGHSDLRVKFQSFKHAGPAAFTLASPGVAPLCKNKTGNCVIRNVTPGTYRYAAVTVDEWGQSLPIFSAVATVPPSR